VRDRYKQVPLAVASGGDRDLVKLTLQAMSLSHFFKTIVTINDVTQGKPAPDLF
jgi:beta-phosphoglucomutase-like phosphatase (HAD superfamily)